jgi:hypothetical protein
MNDVIEMPRRESAGIVANETHQFSAAEIRQRINFIQEILRTLMIKDTHYGVIPGTKKPSLYKPGAEMLCVAFRIADKYAIDDLTVNGMSRFRVRCIGVHQITSVVLGEGLGECSSHEEKYKWRGAICTEEFDLTPENLRRLKFVKWNNNVEKKIQIRTEPEDQANTILKMACKRAKIAMTLNVTGASDIFTQDIEDLPEELRNSEEGGGNQSGDSALLKKWVDQANAAKDADNLALIWTSGIKEIKAANDMPAYEAFKAAVSTKGEAFKAPKQAQNASIPPELEGLIADMEAAADGGSEAFEKSWNTLSKATQEKLAGEYDRLKARAAKVGGSHVPE